MKVIVEVSGHHCHLSEADAETLFGNNYKLTALRPVSQTGQYAAKETVIIKTSGGQLSKVRIVGPYRAETSVEISTTEAYQLKVKAPTVAYKSVVGKDAGAMVEIIGPKGTIKRKALIVPHRHLHISTLDAKKFKLKSGQKVSVRIGGSEAVTFHNVLVRVHSSYVTRVHLDTDEGNAAGIIGCIKGDLIL